MRRNKMGEPTGKDEKCGRIQEKEWRQRSVIGAKTGQPMLHCLGIDRKIFRPGVGSMYALAPQEERDGDQEERRQLKIGRALQGSY